MCPPVCYARRRRSDMPPSSSALAANAYTGSRSATPVSGSCWVLLADADGEAAVLVAVAEADGEAAVVVAVAAALGGVDAFADAEACDEADAVALAEADAVVVASVSAVSVAVGAAAPFCASNGSASPTTAGTAW